MSEEIDPIEVRGYVEFSDTAKSWPARAARNRVLYGKKSNAILHARLILEFARGWSDVLLTDRATQAEWKSFFQDKQTQGLMRG
jgi:hypothetical protein